MHGRIVLTIQDADGDTATVSVHCIIDDGTIAVDISDFYPFSLWYAISSLVNGRLIDAKTELISDISLWPNNVPASVLSDVQEKALFTFTTPSRIPFDVSVPTFIETFFTGAGAGKEVDVTQAEVLAFITVMTEDVASSGISATDSHYVDSSLFVSGRQAFGKR